MAVRTDYDWFCGEILGLAALAKTRREHDALTDAADTIEALASAPKVEMAVEGPFNRAAVYKNCAVQVLANTKTGVSSVSWTQNPEIIEKWEAEEYEEGEDG